MISVRIIKISSQRQAALPGHTQRFFRHTHLRCDIILISTAHRPVYCQHPGLRFSHLLHDLSQPDILSVCCCHPSGIKPEDIQPSILLSKFQDLIAGKCTETLPGFRIFFWIIGGIPCRFSGKYFLFFPIIRTSASPPLNNTPRSQVSLFETRQTWHGRYPHTYVYETDSPLPSSCILYMLYPTDRNRRDVLWSESDTGTHIPLPSLPIPPAEKHPGSNARFNARYCLLKTSPSSVQSTVFLDHSASSSSKCPARHHAKLIVHSPVHHQRQLLILKPLQLLP